MASSGRMTAVKGGTGTVATPANGNTGGQGRRSSQEGTLFSGLTDQKRGSQDAAAQARRQSWAEMGPKPGVLGQMWQNFTKGNANDAK